MLPQCRRVTPRYRRALASHLATTSSINKSGQSKLGDQFTSCISPDCCRAFPACLLSAVRCLSAGKAGAGAGPAVKLSPESGQRSIFVPAAAAEPSSRHAGRGAPAGAPAPGPRPALSRHLAASARRGRAPRPSRAAAVGARAPAAARAPGSAEQRAEAGGDHGNQVSAPPPPQQQPTASPLSPPRTLDFQFPRPLVNPKGLTGSLNPATSYEPSSTTRSLKRPLFPPFFPPFLNPTLPTFPTTLVSSTSQLPYPTVPPTSQPHPVFKRDYGALHYDEYDENHFIEYHHYHDNLYQDDEETAVATIKGTNSPTLRLPTLLPSILLPIEVETFSPSPHQDPGLDPVVDRPLHPSRSSASASSTSGGIFLTTLFLFRGTIL